MWRSFPKLSKFFDENIHLSGIDGRSLNEFTILFLLMWKKYNNGNSKRLTANATLKFQSETL